MISRCCLQGISLWWPTLWSLLQFQVPLSSGRKGEYDVNLSAYHESRGLPSCACIRFWFGMDWWTLVWNEREREREREREGERLHYSPPPAKGFGLEWTDGPVKLWTRNFRQWYTQLGVTPSWVYHCLKFRVQSFTSRLLGSLLADWHSPCASGLEGTLM